MTLIVCGKDFWHIADRLANRTFPLAFFAPPNLQHTCCRWQMNLQPKPGSWGPHHCCKIASILQHAGCKLQVAKSIKGKLFALKARRCLPLLLPNCQKTIANNVKHSRGGAQI